jgi:hypothetical protein
MAYEGGPGNRGTGSAGDQLADFRASLLKQVVSAAKAAGNAPCSVGRVLDTSGSMRNTTNLEKSAVHAFPQASNPEDDCFFVTVSSNPGVITGSTRNAREIDDMSRTVVRELDGAHCPGLFRSHQPHSRPSALARVARDLGTAWTILAAIRRSV